LCPSHIATNSPQLQTVINVVLHGELTHAMATVAASLGVDAVVTVMFAANTRLAQLQAAAAVTTAAIDTSATAPNTPSGAIPPYAKVNTSKQKPGTPAGCKGHHGPHRPSAPVDKREDVPPIRTCPDCRGGVLPASKFCRRNVETISPEYTCQPTEYTINQHRCPCCTPMRRAGASMATRTGCGVLATIRTATT